MPPSKPPRDRIPSTSGLASPEPPELPPEADPFTMISTPPPKSDSAPPVPTNPNVEIDLGVDDTRLIVELMADGRLRAPVQATRELLRDRLRKAEVLRTG